MRIFNIGSQEIAKGFDPKLSIIMQAIIDTKHNEEFNETFKNYEFDLDNGDTVFVIAHIIQWLANHEYWDTVEIVGNKLSKLYKGEH